MRKFSQERTPILKRWFGLCPLLNGLFLFGLVVIGMYFAARHCRMVMQAIWYGVARRYHGAMAKFCAHTQASVAEAIYIFLILAVAVCVVGLVVRLVRNPGRRGHVLYRAGAALFAALSLIYAGYCVLWGCGYYAGSLAERMGIELEPVSVEALGDVTEYFAACANHYGAQVPRDEAGLFSVSRAEILPQALSVYDEVSAQFDCLSGEALVPKPVYFSKVMSALDFTGFFFPFTGEINLNVDSPACMLPSTIAHEMAHQRGVTAEDEANFAAVLSCMEHGEPVYAYSASLLAYIHLSNALYTVDRARWQQIVQSLDETVLADLVDNSRYWEKYHDTLVSRASNTVYGSFLESYGQQLGLRSYGACVDLLVFWYQDAAGV